MITVGYSASIPVINCFHFAGATGPAFVLKPKLSQST